MKVLIMGNSSSGKSTLAKSLTVKHGLAHLDLDILAWADTNPPERLPLAQSESKINAFIEANSKWVIEGCYADLLATVGDKANRLFFMDLSVEQCIANAKSRPWEPHKYESKAAQDANLNMLIEWIEQYPLRDDECAWNAHLNFYKRFSGPKKRMTKMDKPQHL